MSNMTRSGSRATVTTNIAAGGPNVTSTQPNNSTNVIVISLQSEEFIFQKHIYIATDLTEIWDIMITILCCFKLIPGLS